MTTVAAPQWQEPTAREEGRDDRDFWTDRFERGDGDYSDYDDEA
jgi:hypothetical protein